MTGDLVLSARSWDTTQGARYARGPGDHVTDVHLYGSSPVMIKLPRLVNRCRCARVSPAADRQHVVTGEEQIVFPVFEAQVPGSVSGGVHRDQPRPAVPGTACPSTRSKSGSVAGTCDAISNCSSLSRSSSDGGASHARSHAAMSSTRRCLSCSVGASCGRSAGCNAIHAERSAPDTGREGRDSELCEVGHRLLTRAVGGARSLACWPSRVGRRHAPLCGHFGVTL
jgi:hypothetical protein